MPKLLNIGSGIDKGEIVNRFFPDISNKDITRLDINPLVEPDVIHDISQPLPEELRGQFDIVFSNHMLEHMDRVNVVPAVRNMASGLKNLGEMWIIVPSFDWVCSQILQHRDGLHIQGMMFGAQRDEWDYHRCSFTLNALRTIVEICGLITKRAFQSPFTLLMDGKKFDAIQNIVVAMRVDVLSESEDK